MKRTLTIAFACLAMSLIAVFATGCESLGISTSTEGPAAKQATVTAPTIGEEGVLRVGVNSSNAPFASQVSGKTVGLDIDVASAIADELGLKVEIVDVDGDPEGALTNGSVDIVMGMEKSDTAAACWLSDAYVESAVALFSNDAQAKVPAADSKPKIAAQASSMSAWEVTNQYGDESLVSESELKSAFSDLESGKAQYVAADAIVGTYFTKSSEAGIDIVGLLQKPSGYCVGANSSNTALKTAITNAIKTLESNGLMDTIERKWMSDPVDLDSLSLSEAAAKGSVKKDGVGSNAVDPSEAKEEQAEETTAEEDTATAQEPAAEEAAPVVDNATYSNTTNTYDATAGTGYYDANAYGATGTYDNTGVYGNSGTYDYTGTYNNTDAYNATGTYDNSTTYDNTGAYDATGTYDAAAAGATTYDTTGAATGTYDNAGTGSTDQGTTY